jgi:hypothetical protein
MGMLKVLGAGILVLWLALKITSGVIHLLVFVGIAMIVIGFAKRS